MFDDLESILGEEVVARSEQLAEAVAEEEAVPEELIEALPRILRLLGRELRLGRSATAHGTAPNPQSALSEIHSELVPLLDRHNEIHIRVKIDGLYVGGEQLLPVVPQDDRALFRLFQHGVRQFSFTQGLTTGELEDFVKVINTDPEALDHVEEDISTLLVDQEFDSIHFVVVDTFMEGAGGGGAADQRRAVDLAEVVSAALQQSLSGRPELSDPGQGGTVRFMAADVTFLEQNDLVSLLSTLQPGRSDEAAAGEVDPELASLARTVEGALERWTPWLPAAVLRAFEGATDEEVEALCRLLGSQLWADAQRSSLGAVERQLDEIGSWLDAFQGEPPAIAQTLTKAVFSVRLSRMALSALKSGDPDDELAAISVFRRLTPEERGKALLDVCALAPGPARAGAIVALLRSPLPPLEPLLERLTSFDARAARGVLGALAQGEPDPATIAAFHVALTHPDPAIRAEAVGWFVDSAGDRAAAVLSDALRDASPVVRGAALFLLVDRRPSYGAALLKTWFASPQFRKLPMDEKRLGACALAATAGQSALPVFRKHLRRLNLTGDPSLEELRASAVAALGLLGDTESKERIGKLARSRLCGPVLQDEAKAVEAALAWGRLATADPFKELRRIAAEVGLAETSAEARAERSAGPEADSSTAETHVVPQPGFVAEAPTVPPPADRPSGEPPVQSHATIQALVPPPAKLRVLAAEAAPDQSEERELLEELAEDLLQAYSFDDLPLVVPLTARDRRTEPGGDQR